MPPPERPFDPLKDDLFPDDTVDEAAEEFLYQSCASDTEEPGLGQCSMARKGKKSFLMPCTWDTEEVPGEHLLDTLHCPSGHCARHGHADNEGLYTCLFNVGMRSAPELSVAGMPTWLLSLRAARARVILDFTAETSKSMKACPAWPRLLIAATIADGSTIQILTAADYSHVWAVENDWSRPLGHGVAAGVDLDTHARQVGSQGFSVLIVKPAEPQ